MLKQMRKEWSAEERIDAYLRNEMSHEERKDFEEELKVYPALRQDYALTQKITNALASQAEKREKISRWMALDKAKNQRTDRGKYLKVAAMVAAISVAAASLIVGVESVRESATDGMTGTVVTAQLQESGYGSMTPGEIEKALKDVDAIMLSIEVAAAESGNSGNPTYRQQMYKLKWKKIQLLLAANKKSAAIKMLREYRLQEGEHKEASEALFKELKGR